ncbi:MAG: Phosphoglycerate kinase, partial [Candidatus Falkowbacteria bacterium GW2011_GWF2_39_8]
MKIKSIRQIKDFAGKKVLLRADFNVPIAKGKVNEDYKLVKSLPMIRYLMRYGAKLVIVTHMSNEKQSTQPVARRLSQLLGRPVKFIPDSIGEKPNTAVDKLKDKEILFLQNIRFNKEEETNDKRFAKELSRPYDLYINDAFGVSHREHASLSAIKKFLPSFAGFTVEEEVELAQRIKKGDQAALEKLTRANLRFVVSVAKQYQNQG